MAKKILIILAITLGALSYNSIKSKNSKNLYFQNRQVANEVKNIFKNKIDKLFGAIELVLSSPRLNFVRAVVDTDEVFKHYQNLISDTMGLLNIGRDFGAGATGYSSINQYLTNERLDFVSEGFEKIDQSITNNNDWKTWPGLLKMTDGNTLIPLIAIIYSDGWSKEASIHKLDVQFSCQPYGNSFYLNEFGLDNLVPCDQDTSTLGWGKGYKVVAGMSLYLALFDKGYSVEDSLFLTKMSFLMYEAADLLYDHGGLKPKDAFQPDDDVTVEGLGEVITKLHKKLSLAPNKKKLNHEMLKHLTQLGAITKLFSNNFNLLDDEFLLSAGIINLYISDKNYFRKQILSLLESEVDQAFYEDYVRQSANDVLVPLEGANFILKKLKPKDSNHIKDKKFEGIYNDSLVRIFTFFK